MAPVTKFITALVSANTLYDIFRDAEGKVLNNTSLELETWGASNHTRVDYAFALTNKSGDMFTAAVDDNFPIGATLFRFTYEQGGANPAEGDTLLYGPIPVEWTGESVIVDGEEASITDLCNYAYAKIGGAWKQNKLSSYFETTDSAEQCQLLWPKVRKEVLVRGSKEGFNWQEAVKYAESGDELSGDNIPDMAEWEYAFTLPSDYLRMIAQISEAHHTTEYEFEVMRGMLLTNTYSNDDGDSAYLKYIYDNDVPTTYGDPLYNAMATKLAAELAGVTVGAKRRSELIQEYEGLILQLASSKSQTEVFHDDKGYTNPAERRFHRYGRENG